MKAVCVYALAAAVLFPAVAFAGTSGKIVGIVKDSRTGEPLPSANVTVEGTTLGAATNVDGYYVILNVPPGRYKLNISLVGYRTMSATGVRVDIDQTTTQNFSLAEEAVTGEEVTVVAQRPVVQRDVAASRANIVIEDVNKLPVTSVTGVVGLQAGIQGLSIRGGTIDQTAFIVDGLVLRDDRTNQPYTGVALSAVQDVQVQTGGFNAEYGNIRSGIVNVVTREGSRRSYSFNFQGRYSPAAPKHFGPAIYDKNSYWVRPYVDGDVAWTGTGKTYDAGAWDKWTRDQYPYFEGWNAVSQKLLADANPSNDLSPAAAQQLWLWEYRRRAEVAQGDWDVDLGFGGPVPGGEYLGDLRFFASYRQARNYYIVPLSRDSYMDLSGQIKVTADLLPTMKIQFSYLRGYQNGTNSNNTGEPGIFSSASGIASALSQVSYIDARIFATDYWAPTDVNVDVYGLKLTHNVSPTLFYEATVQRYWQKTDTNPGRLRNDSDYVARFGNAYYVDEAPYGFQPEPSTGITGLRMGVGMSNSRDTSRIHTILGRFDLTTQFDQYNQLKAGVEVSYTSNDVSSASIDEFLPSGRYRTSWHNFPWRVAAYLQDKLEFEGMIANIGLRLDYLNPNGDWYVNYDPFDKAFSGAYSLGIDTLLEKQKIEPLLNLSPRLGIAFPITDDAKLFFNYGHFYQVPDPRNMFLLRRYISDNKVANLASPSEPIPRTVAYELGYEHSLFDQFLARVTFYYKDISNESFSVSYYNRNSTVSYSQYTSNRYRDIRGFEISLNKNRGEWIQGFANYTYDVRTTGYFGLGAYYESSTDQRIYERNTVYQEKPIPQPFARANIDVFTPDRWGPEFAGIYPFDNWRLNFLFAWSSGFYFTWTGGGSIPGIQNNVQWRDYYNLDMRLSKTFRMQKLGVEFFVDLFNALNTRYMSTSYGFVTGTDYEQYMKSLHLPKEIGDPLKYGNIPGDDTPGDYRDEGVQYQPIVSVGSYNNLIAATDATYKQARPFYFSQETGQYFQYDPTSSTYSLVDPARLQQVLDDKAYIDMPNQETFTFLNPRRWFFGIRLSFDM